MGNRTLILLLLGIAHTCISAQSHLDKDPNTLVKPNDLTVEWIRVPEQVEILDPSPEYGWTVPNMAKAQAAYQLLVASSKENLNNGIGDIWDSGKIWSNVSSDVPHEGKDLLPGNTYFWKVRIWDHELRTSAYSKIQRFLMGTVGNNITTPNSFQVDKISPVVFEKRGKTYFMDFGKAAFATIDFTYKAKSDHTLTIRIGEQLKGRGINREPSKKSTIRYQEIEVPVQPDKTEYQLQIRPDKRNTLPGKALPLPDGFPVLMPFRYAEIEGAKKKLSADDFIQLAHHSYWEEDASSFESSNEILNQVWDLCKYSIKATTFNGLYVDGDRERIPYEADAYLNQLSHYATDREYAIARQTIEYFMENPTWPTEWQQHVALMFYADYMYTGNTELIEKYYEDLKHKTLMELAREDGLITSTKVTPEFMKKLGFKNPNEKLRDIVDWPPAQKDTGWQLATEEGERDGFVFMPYNTVINSFYYENMRIMSKFATVLGKADEALNFKLLALKAKKAINAKLLDIDKGYYVDGEGTDHSSIHANMMPLAFGIVPKEYIPSVVKFIKSRGMACSVYGAQYLLDALYNAGEDDYALDLMKDQSDRSWYNMLKIGSTITLEAWDMKYKPNADWNHAWGAVPANVIPRRLWGIEPKTPGFGIALIKPQMGSLTSSAIKVPTIKGTIHGDYKVEGGVKTYTIEIPANMGAEFELAYPKDQLLVHNGNKIPRTFKFLRLNSGKHVIQLEKSL